MALPWRLKYWNGSSWVNAELRRWNGSSWVTANMYFYNGSAWELCTDRTPPTQTYTRTYNAAWTGTYRENGTLRTDSKADTYNFQGDSGASTWGNQRCMWGLPTTVRTDAAGAVARYSARVWFDNEWTWYNAGGTAVVGTHNRTSQPSTFTANRNDQVRIKFSRGQAKWTAISTNFILWAGQGSMYGFTMYINSRDVEYYGYYTKAITYEQSYEK